MAANRHLTSWSKYIMILRMKRIWFVCTRTTMWRSFQFLNSKVKINGLKDSSVKRSASYMLETSWSSIKSIWLLQVLSSDPYCSGRSPEIMQMAMQWVSRTCLQFLCCIGSRDTLVSSLMSGSWRSRPIIRVYSWFLYRMIVQSGSGRPKKVMENSSKFKKCTVTDQGYGQ